MVSEALPGIGARVLDDMGWEIQIPVKSGRSGVYEVVGLLCCVCLKFKSTRRDTRGQRKARCQRRERSTRASTQEECIRNQQFARAFILIEWKETIGRFGPN